MLTNNQQAIIDSITQEFLTFNEQRKVVSKPYSFFDTSVLDSENEYTAEQIEEAKIINKSIATLIGNIFQSDISLLKEDMPRLPISHLRTTNNYNGTPRWEIDTIAILKIGNGDRGLTINYDATGKRYTAANGTTYVVLDGGYKVVYKDYSGGDIVEPTLADLFANEKFVQKVTRLYRDQTKIN